MATLTLFLFFSIIFFYRYVSDSVRCVVRIRYFETEIGLYELHATRIFRVQPRMFLIMPAMSRKSTKFSRTVFQFLIFVIRRSGSVAVSIHLRPWDLAIEDPRLLQFL